MSDFTTELMNALQKDFPLNEIFRQQLESAVNGLLQSEITAFLGYEKHSSDGWNSGNSRNGSYVRTLTTSYGDLRILVPRDRNGLFAQKTIPRHTQHTDALETTALPSRCDNTRNQQPHRTDVWTSLHTVHRVEYRQSGR